jgi:hypothetical protein
MQELFAADRMRQERWIAEASARGAPAGLEPLKPRSKFWSTVEDVDLPPSASAAAAALGAPAAPAGLAPAPVAPVAPATKKPQTSVVLMLAIALAVALFVIIALAMR